jgi:hypothetical protein
MRWAGHAARMGEMRDMYYILIRNLEERRPLQKFIHSFIHTRRYNSI